MSPSRALPDWAPPAGLKPATVGLEGHCSIQLSYGGNRRETTPVAGKRKPEPLRSASFVRKLDGVRLLLNILWIVLGGGWLIFAEYLLGGLLLCLTVVGIPFGVQCFKIAGLGLLPFGKRIEHDPRAAGGGCLGTIMNILWFFVAGVWIFLSHLALGLAAAITIIGIPFAMQHLKLGMLALSPFGKKVRVDG